MYRAYDVHPLLWCAPWTSDSPPARVLAVVLCSPWCTKPLACVNLLGSLLSLVSPQDTIALGAVVEKLSDVREAGGRHQSWGPSVSWGQHFAAVLDPKQPLEPQLLEDLILRYPGDQFSAPA